MGPSRASQESSNRQDVVDTEGGRGRERQCLLKGCDQPFRAKHPLARYCSGECRREARRWQRWKARLRYRSSPRGRGKRRDQSRRRRERLERARDRETISEPRVGDPKHCPRGFSCCDRPGCYECFAPSARSPLRRFCSPNCRRALRRVTLREARYRRRRRSAEGPPHRAAEIFI